MLETNAEFLRPEIMDVLRLFNAEDGDFCHAFLSEGSVFINVIISGKKAYIFKNTAEYGGDIVFKRFAKRFCKLSFYKLLSKESGVDLPWGALTGIRPTKLAYQEMEAGRDFKRLFAELKVKNANISLVERVIAAQKPAYKAGGQDLYISLPFCPTKCEYCSFITAPISATRGYVDGYVDCLLREIECAAPYLDDVRSIYIGGGTPFVLESEHLTRIYAAVNRYLKPDTEFTVEAGRPDTFTEEKLKACRDFGVTRICVNPQTFSDETLQRIGRKHTAAQIYSAYDMARKFDFDINLDLICGLTGETPADVENSLNCAVKLNPENITVHTLSLKAGAKLKENVKRLSGETVGDMVDLSRNILSENGYDPYYLYRQKYQAGGHENTGWCKAGKVCRYNVGVMEEISDNVALGAGAVSKRVFPSGGRIERYASPKDIPTYIAKTEKIIEDREKFYKR